MKSLCVLNGTGTPAVPLLTEDGRSAAQLTVSRMSGRFAQLIVVTGEQGAAGLDGKDVVMHCVPGEDMHGVLQLLLENYPGYDVYLFADLYAPFVDGALAERYAAMTVERIAHYTYGEHYPRGIAPQALSAEAVRILAGIASGNNRPFDDEAIMDLMGLDINSYDIEIDVSPVDFRRYRLDLRTRSRISCRLIGQLLSNAAVPPEQFGIEQLAELITGDSGVQRTLPAYVELDLSDNCNLNCCFCPRQALGTGGVSDGPFVEPGQVGQLIGQLKELNPEAMVALSPYSEPLLHPQFREIAAHILDNGFRLLVETNGVCLTDQLLSFFADQPVDQLIVIVSLDTLNSEQYAEWKGEVDYQKLMTDLECLFTLKPRNSFVQVLHMEGLAEEVDGFYRFWKKHQERVLPRKYNSFCGVLPERQITDLSPLRRAPCWHLQRDLVIRADGSVNLCKQDLQANFMRGNVWQEGLAAVWERLHDDFQNHLKSGFQQPQLCQGCDEWYTYNN